MNKVSSLTAILLFLFIQNLSAQTVYVDAIKGNDSGAGTLQAPLSSIQKAVDLVADFTGKEDIHIKLLPGLYLLKDKVVLDKIRNESSWLSIEAAVMPDNPDWEPTKMPVIQSVSSNNSVTQFPHSIGFLIASNNVALKGLKFTGNANPDVKYYYPVNRENESLKGLDISQCYFIGERNSSPIQGSIWAHGAGTHVDHCIFYGCKNALLLFKSISDFSLTNSIIYGAYEAAVWFGPFSSDFVFKNNIVSNCTYFWLRAENTFPKYTFNNSLIINNEGFMGYYAKDGAIPADKNEHTENQIRKSGKLILSEVKTSGLPKDYLNPTKGSAGKELGAGIFINPKN
ncbi:right-handed parallel beta-helix repeat-containing protein [Dyadobacter subterraneus]|uniref:Right-handed parallel beta-helix repeat-containing protein n=1 Tax=Dyadobacter subterraneus TaxID=2773304 RepID=A0ABR9WG30_9BACT|nr:right-handed parallel beta-helix repeat-containing protein [Dyadobacter subterraneus]MBE9464465.1 right-handed parallel beta-helix repeat-containing protein [Dyadobacter subterraneus]